MKFTLFFLCSALCALHLRAQPPAEIVYIGKPAQPVFDTAFNRMNPENPVFYISSEGHEYPASNAIEDLLRRNLCRYHGVRNFVLEREHSAAVIINKYLETGDEQFMLGKSPAGRARLKALKEFRDSLPEAQRFRFWGIDFDIDYGRLPYYQTGVRTLLRDKIPDPKLNRFLADLSSVRKARRLNGYLKRSIRRHPALFRDHLPGNDLMDLRIIAGSIDRHHNAARRDGEMMRKLKAIQSNFLTDASGQVRIFGQFGVYHTDPSRSSLSRRIVKRYGKANVLNMGFYCRNCAIVDQRTGNAKGLGRESEFIGRGDFREAVPDQGPGMHIIRGARHTDYDLLLFVSGL